MPDSLVGLLERLFEAATRGGCRHTKARGHGHRIFGDEVRLHDPVTQLFGQVRGFGQARTRADENELFAAPATEAIGVAGVRTQDFADRLQHTVTGVVPAMIVDLLEVVEIDDDDAGR